MKSLKTGLLVTLIFLSLISFSQTRIIFDTDFGGDADDLGALAMLNNFMSRGECELLAIACWSTEQNAVKAIKATNRFYKHPDIPVGVRKEGTYYDSLSYSKPLADKFYHEPNNENFTDAIILYRKILSESEDKGITIVAVGPLKNLQNLIQSKSDSISELSGKELINKKVKEFVIMGGQFPEGKKEWNFDGNMPGVTKFVIQNIEVPIVFSGFEVGTVIKTGEVFNNIDKTTPLYIGFKYFSQHASWMKADYKGKILDNASYDQTAILYAVRNGVGQYWDKIENGRCVPDDTGGNRWISDNSTNHSYLRLKMDKEEIAKLIEDIMLGNF